MRKTSTSTLICLSAVVLVGLIAAQPLFTYGLPRGDDTIYHVQRVASLARSLRQGVIYPRWSADLAYGFGYPIFNYYTPLFYYLAVAFVALESSTVHAVAATSALLFVAQALGCWLWFRLELDGLAAFWGAVTYTLASYTISNVTGRGALAEHLALSVLPFVGWAIGRLSRTGHPIWFAFAAFATAALVLSHNVSALLLMGFVLVYAGLSSLSYRTPLPLLALGTGVLLTAFFWIPIISELELVQADVLHSADCASYRDHFLPLDAQFAWPEPADPLLNAQWHGPALNAVVVAVTLVGAAAQSIRLAQRRDRKALLILLAWVTFVGALFMAHPASLPIWQWIGPLRFLQFPWRFYGLVVLGLSLLSAAGAQAIGHLLRNRPVLLTILSACWLGFGASYSYARQMPLSVLSTDLDTSPAGIAQAEWSSNFIGTTAAGEYLPAAVLERPPFDLSIFAGPAAVDFTSTSRLAYEMLPEAVEIVQETYTPYRYVVRISTPHASEVIFKTFYFPGWMAYVDGVETSITPTQPHGLIGVPVAAGEHDIIVAFESTPLRDRAALVSCVTLLMLGGATGYGLYRRRRARQTPQQLLLMPWPEAGYRSPVRWGGIVIAAGIMLAAKTFWVDRGPTPFGFTRFDGTSVRDADVMAQELFGDGLVLIGADVPGQIRPMDEELSLTLYWRLARVLNEEYSTSVRLLDPQGTLIGQSDNQHPDGLPVTEWHVDRYQRDRHAVPICPGTPPGRYRILVSVYPYGRPDSLLDVRNSLGEPVGADVEIASVEVLPTQWPAEPSALGIADYRPPTGQHAFELIGFTRSVDQAMVGDLVPFILYWQANRDIHDRHDVSLRLLDDRGQVAADWTLDPVPDYPTDLWRQEDVWRGTHRVVIPPHLDTRTYRLQVAYAESQPVDLGSLAITAPHRTFAEPDIGVSERVAFVDVGEIVRVMAPGEVRVGEAITVTLVWRATQTTARPYKVFVHLVDEAGRLVAGHDSEPVNWERRTTGWLPGEYLVDDHTVRIPERAPARYNLRVGLYDPVSNQRVLTATGEEYAILSMMIDVVEE